MIPTRIPTRGEQGGLVLMVAVLAVVLIGLSGLAVDVGRYVTTSQHLQNAADASALAAAAYLVTDGTPSDPSDTYPLTRDAAGSCALANQADAIPVRLNANSDNTPGGDIVVGIWNRDDRTFTPDVTVPNAVRVRAQRSATSPDGQLDLVFGSAFGSAFSDVQSEAIAVVAPAPEPHIIVLDPSDRAAFEMKGTPVLALPYGSVQVNSSASCAASLKGTPQMYAYALYTAGSTCAPDGAMTGYIEDGVEPAPDPLAHVLPDVGAWDAYKGSMPMPKGATGDITTGGNYTPGYYPGGVNLGSHDVVNLAAGVYMFGGDGITLHGGQQIVGDDVTLLVDLGGTILTSGTDPGIYITASTSGLFENIGIMLHRDTTASPAVKLAGTGSFDITGYIYVPGGTVSLTGTSEKALGAIVANKVSISGTATINGKDIPTTTMGTFTYLVQ